MHLPNYRLVSTLLFLASLWINSATAQPSPSDLIKVTSENNPKCVEYYAYQNDIYCSTKAFFSNSPDPNLIHAEHLHIIFDKRPWRLAWGKQDDQLTMLEYVPSDEDINAWNELITSQFIPNPPQQLSLMQDANLLIANLKQAGFNPKITIFENTKDRFIFEFQINSPKNQVQDELQAILRDQKGIYILHYVIKQSDMGEKNRNFWLKNLKNSSIKR